jgi:hypothetical protein
VAYCEHKKGGNCPKSKSSNNQRRTEIKQSSSKFYRRNAKKQIEQQIKDILE